MKTIKIKRECNIKGKKYIVGDTFKPTKEDMPLICRLNEKGFIDPLNGKQLNKIKNDLCKSIKEENNGYTD